jgi:hypothetical protein
MRIEKQINMDMLRRCNQALDNSQDLINFYHKLVRKVEKQEKNAKKKDQDSRVTITNSL